MRRSGGSVAPLEQTNRVRGIADAWRGRPAARRSALKLRIATKQRLLKIADFRWF